MSTVTKPGLGELLDDAGRPCALLRVQLEYSAADPYAVSATFADTVWVFGRDLLRDGLAAPAGLGDVHVAPGRGGTVVVTLRSADGNASVALSAPEVAAFVAATDAVVPPGREAEHLGDWSTAPDRPRGTR